MTLREAFAAHLNPTDPHTKYANGASDCGRWFYAVHNLRTDRILIAEYRRTDTGHLATRYVDEYPDSTAWAPSHRTPPNDWGGPDTEDPQEQERQVRAVAAWREMIREPFTDPFANYGRRRR